VLPSNLRLFIAGRGESQIASKNVQNTEVVFEVFWAASTAQSHLEPIHWSVLDEGEDINTLGAVAAVAIPDFETVSKSC
jgi:hypothetical protein